MKWRPGGMGLCLGFSLIFLLTFFGKVIRDPCNTWFSTGGDGMKAYYTALYHVKYDSLALRSNAMNYPFGEVLSFTDNQPLVVNTVRAIAESFPGVREHTTGILNLMMLLSILLGALFIFLILSESGVSWWYAAIAATGIAFLSPQLNRLGGHFSLSWVFWIPLVAWLIIRFDRSRWLIYSLLLGVTTFMAGFLHFYYVGFIGFLVGGYWLFRFVYYRRASTFWYRDVLHIFLQFILPLLLLQLLVLLNDDVIDRTGYPFGYQGSTAHPVAVFLPSGTPWAFVSRFLTVFKHINWESYAYIGTVALMGCLTGIFFLIRRIVRKETFHRVSEVKPVNVIFWISFFALLFSIGIPFILGMERLYEYLGPFRQLRVLARFSWIFYYMVNIVVFASLFHRAFTTPAKWWWKSLAFAALALLLFEAASNARGIAVHLNNRMVLLEDRDNDLPENQWVHRINPSGYQAIMPIPYFHVGSENIWVENGPEIKEAVMVASLKTGLPTTGVEMSRTSISQTYINYSLYTEPLQRAELTDYLPDERPFLVLWLNSYEPTPPERWLLRGATLLDSTGQFTLLSLPVGQIKSLHETWRRNVFQKFENQYHTPRNGVLVSDPHAFFTWLTYDEHPSRHPLRGSGALSFSSGKQVTLFSGALEEVPGKRSVTVGFWLYRYQDDGSLRTEMTLSQQDPETGRVLQSVTTPLFKHVKAFQGDWALVEAAFETISDNEIVEISLMHSVVPNAHFVVDELLIRESEIDVWQSGENFLIFNGRYFVRRENR
ncbi:MAG TPA: hypothetical protein PLD74_05645 [Prolixibacteraceae bacterium]|nr:hypothetical protein [Prolixibacteraceae bacterium]HOS91038.1 hypothetical protein [Prolixibacteraceae bacterium]HQE51828.1 hypothetical protein [Prolixibacteraceae bacterium]HQH75550.1 hypothetical protein [Prolixibacteraceae bacterium]HQJ84787.1 hypothetical protein [Prolixibacteraceae bacterium]